MRPVPPGWAVNAEKWAERFASLTPLQRETARMLALGHPVRDIAVLRFRTPSAIRAMARVVYQKTCCSTVADLARAAVAAGLVGVDDPPEKHSTWKRRCQQGTGRGGRGQTAPGSGLSTSTGSSPRHAQAHRLPAR